MASKTELNDAANKSQLLDIVQEMFQDIHTGVSYKKFITMLPTKSNNAELYKHVVDNISDMNHGSVDYKVITEFFEDKHNEIVKLSEESSKNRVAWRPTGEVDVASIKGKILALQKQHILHKINEVVNETNQLKAKITMERLALEKQIESTKLI